MNKKKTYFYNMFVKEVQKPNGSTSVRVVESVRIGKKIKQKTLRIIGQGLKTWEIEALKKIAEQTIVDIKNERQPVLDGFDPAEIYERKIKSKRINVTQIREEKRINNGFQDVMGKAYDQLDFFSIIDNTRKDNEWNEILKANVIARIANPDSKRKTTSILEKDFNLKIPLEKTYRMMDRVISFETKIKDMIYNRTSLLLNNKVDVMFFDVTTLYFESFIEDDLRSFGFSKDCKFKETQIVLALITSHEGLPIDYQVFPGNTSEGTTLIEMIEDLSKKYNIENVVLVADRAMFTEKNLIALEDRKIKYVVAAKLKKLKKDMKEKILNDIFKPQIINNEFIWTNEYEIDHRRLIISYSTKRAKKDEKDRKRLVDRLMKKTKSGKIKVQDLINNYGTKKYIKVLEGSAIVNEEKIKQDSRWDGLHGIISNVKDEKASELLIRYRGLWQIEAAFRVNKHDLKMRPIYHWKKERIKAHILICYLAYALVAHVRFILKSKGVDISVEKLREELINIEASILKHTKTKSRYLMPSNMNDLQLKIYKAMGISEKTMLQEI